MFAPATYSPFTAEQLNAALEMGVLRRFPQLGVCSRRGIEFVAFSGDRFVPMRRYRAVKFGVVAVLVSLGLWGVPAVLLLLRGGDDNLRQDQV